MSLEMPRDDDTMGDILCISSCDMKGKAEVSIGGRGIDWKTNEFYNLNLILNNKNHSKFKNFFFVALKNCEMTNMQITSFMAFQWN